MSVDLLVRAKRCRGKSIFHGRSADKLTFEDVRDYRLHLISRGLKPNSINPMMGALRFFYRTTLGCWAIPGGGDIVTADHDGNPIMANSLVNMVCHDLIERCKGSRIVGAQSDPVIGLIYRFIGRF